MSSNTTNVSNVLTVGIIRYAAHNPREVKKTLQVKLNGRQVKNWPVQPEEAGKSESLDKLAYKVLGSDASTSKYAFAKGRCKHGADSTTLALSDDNPTHVFFVSDHGLRAYGGVNSYDVINIEDDLHVVAIPLNKAEQAIKNIVFQ